MAISLGDLGEQIKGGLADVSAKTMQAALVAGGLFMSFIMTPATTPTRKNAMMNNVMFIGGLGLAAVGGAWWLKDSAAAATTPKAKVATIEPTMIYNPIETRSYTNPVNNLDAVPPRNRFDKQSNYIMSRADTNTDAYLNSLIINEAKALGFGNIGNYPVRMQPYQIKSLIPTTQVEPSRDTNTVKMLA